MPAFIPILVLARVEPHVRRLLAAAAVALADNHPAAAHLDELLPTTASPRPPRRCLDPVAHRLHHANTGTGADACDLTPETDPDGPIP